MAVSLALRCEDVPCWVASGAIVLGLARSSHGKDSSDRQRRVVVCGSTSAASWQQRLGGRAPSAVRESEGHTWTDRHSSFPGLQEARPQRGQPSRKFVQLRDWQHFGYGRDLELFREPLNVDLT